MESKDAYTTRMLEEHKELIAEWTREQHSLRKSVLFVDHELDFFVPTSGSDFQHEMSVVQHDFDVPEVHQVNIGEPLVTALKYVGGLDISFVQQSEDSSGMTESEESQSHVVVTENGPNAYATLVVVEYPSLELRHTITHAIHMDVPYIPTFFSYREAPVYLRLINALREELAARNEQDQFPQVFLIDGNGRLHVRETGVASVVGVQANVPTIGVAKNYLPHHQDSLQGQPWATSTAHWRSTQHGMREMIRRVLLSHGSWFGLYDAKGDSYAGAALIPPTLKAPLFVSPGHRVCLDTAIRVTLALGRYKIPEPIRLADKISRAAVAASVTSS
ncbi:hypothetical protein DACRYDRAFT_89016 [Dacryopinax primogenitus]|uniref:Endonuclease V n=1 Tax=Dacryopinax primogenitus (strain DJM 731) TaxID=1858805 RepID=M5FVW4_DACPD|nr:uncharacterized protein DACRYDRAFT_89016 [Dacryopinax primogenitus]EJU01986.1 hypothetical protein DACRYDRAFT_89016 [Dacryopinax primogenitus]